MASRPRFTGLRYIIGAVFFVFGIVFYLSPQRHSSPSNVEQVTNAKIAIVTVLRKMADRDNYTTAMTSMECYSKRYNYKYIVVDSDMYKNVCKQELVDFH
ncbi:hypothetical protein Y032_0054g2500 [Ancylostoma ceylanicum]|uniref:Uncharacterized protein n=1 Tax=Ancylostoma ceylanicum TaxID=53326 RepID=A0A016U769_9BILA|nr:hypothetical protein Y032_0054g2500 [Ancylostoma ceylanicum]